MNPVIKNYSLLTPVIPERVNRVAGLLGKIEDPYEAFLALRGNVDNNTIARVIACCDDNFDPETFDLQVAREFFYEVERDVQQQEKAEAEEAKDRARKHREEQRSRMKSNLEKRQKERAERAAKHRARLQTPEGTNLPDDPLHINSTTEQDEDNEESES